MRVFACLVLLLLWPGLVLAQLPVTDVGNLSVNTISSAQNTITAAQTVIIVEHQIEELMALDGIITAEGIAEDMALIGEIISQVEGLSFDVGALQSQITELFDLDAAPTDTTMLRERLGDIRRLRYQSYRYAMKLQTLMMTMIRTVEHVIGLINSVGDFIGAKQGSQTLVQVNSTISKTLVVLEVQTASYQRAGSVDKLEELLTIESLHLIREEVMADWPTR
jgi:conjugal transfer/entry exclusion protein